MSQIKKKFIADKAIDGSKILLQNGEALKALTAGGSEQSLMSFNNGDALVFGVVPEFGSDPTSGNHLVRKAYADEKVSIEQARAEAAEEALANRLDGLELDATTTTYVDNLNTATNARIDDIISNVDPSALDSLSEIVSAFQAADGDLQAAITAALGTHTSELAEEVSRATAEEARIEGKVDSEISDRQSEITRVEGLVSDEEARAMVAESALSSAISDEETRAVGEESRIEGLVSQEVLDRQAAVSAEETARIAGDSAEQSRAMSAESALSGRLDVLEADPTTKTYVDGQIASEQQVRDAEVTALDGRLDILEGEETVEGSVAKALKDAKDYTDVEQARAEGEESRIEGLVTQEVADRQAAVSAEQSRAQTAEAGLQSNIDAEEARAMGEESRIEGKVDQEVLDRATAVSAEESARIAGDSNLQGQLDTEKGRIDAILLASEADKDSFAEIVSLINSVDTENDTAFASYVLSNDAALAQEVSDRQSGDSQLQSNLDAEEAARIAGDANLQSQIDSLSSGSSASVAAEQARAEGEEARIEAKLDQEISDRAAAVSAEEAARIAADISVRNDMTDSINLLNDEFVFFRSSQETFNTVLNQAILDEQSRATGEEGRIEGLLLQEVSDRESAVSAEETRAMAAEAGLQSAIDQEISDRQSEVTRLEGLVSDEETRAMAAESLLSGRLDVLEAVVHEKESFTLSATDVSNGYIDLGAEAKGKSTMVHAGRLYGHEGVDYTLSVVGGVTRITFAGELASGGVSALVSGDTVYVKYMK